jgi:hypothetical protein
MKKQLLRTRMQPASAIPTTQGASFLIVSSPLKSVSRVVNAEYLVGVFIGHVIGTRTGFIKVTRSSSRPSGRHLGQAVVSSEHTEPRKELKKAGRLEDLAQRRRKPMEPYLRRSASAAELFAEEEARLSRQIEGPVERGKSGKQSEAGCRRSLPSSRRGLVC